LIIDSMSRESIGIPVFLPIPAFRIAADNGRGYA